MSKTNLITEIRQLENDLENFGVKSLEVFLDDYLQSASEAELLEDKQSLIEQIQRKQTAIAQDALHGKKKMEQPTETEKPKQLPACQRSIVEIVKDLTKPVAQKHLRKRKQGGKELTYISWFDAVKYLDYYASGWSYEITRMDSLGGKVILVVRLSIPCLEGVVYREATGQEDENLESYGDSTSNSESMALRRAAAKFGLGLYLYDK